MAKAGASWAVHEHGSLRLLQDNLYYVDGAVPRLPLRRCMSVARMASGELVVHNAIALDEASMARLDAFGEVAYILVPGGGHRLDAPAFHERYPKAKILCPPGARKKVQEVVAVDGSYDDFPQDEAVSLEVLDGVKGGEGVMKVASGSELTLVFNDVLFNIPREKAGFLLRLLGSSGGLKVTRVARLLLVKDKKALGAHLARLAELPGLTRLVPGHGDVVEDDAPALLRALVA